MRAKTTIVSSLLCAVLVLGFAMSAQANTTYQVQTSPLNAVKNGVAEVMGDVSLTVAGSPAPTAIGTNDQITITYAQSAIVNNDAGTANSVVVGPFNTATGGASGWIVTAPTTSFPAFSVKVTSNVASIGGTVTITFLGAGLVPIAGDTITVKNIRASVVGRAISSIVITQFTAAPSGSSSFITTSSPTVAFVVDNFSISAFAGGGGLAKPFAICNPTGGLAFTVKEESLTTWVQYKIAGTFVPTDGRSVFPQQAGGNANSQVHFVLNGLPLGVTVYWPDQINSNETVGTGNSALIRLSESATGNDAVYQFGTPSQAASDSVIETYNFAFVASSSGTAPVSTSVGRIVVAPTTPTNSATTLQAQMYPLDTTTATDMPRFADPLHTSADAASFVDCITNLLFPWVGSLPDFGYDTGIAVANTGYDVGALTPPTVGDPGVIRFYFYPQTFGAAPVAPTPVTTAELVPGDTYAAPFSSFGASKFGYLIAVCEFRFAHGFAYITQGTIGGTLDTAQGYLALVMNTGSTGTGRTFIESLGE